MKNVKIVIPRSKATRNPVLSRTRSFAALGITVMLLLAISLAQPVQATFHFPSDPDLSPFQNVKSESDELYIGKKFGAGGAGALIRIFGTKIGFPAKAEEPEVIVGKIAQGLLVVIGAIFGVLIIYAGVRWMTARGNEETVKEAIETLQAAVIGFVVVVGAYAITAYVVGKVISAALPP